MYCPRRAGRGTTSFPSDAWSALFVCAWCAGTRHPTVSERRPEQPSTAGQIGTVFALQTLQLKNTILIRFAGFQVRVVAPSSDCKLRDSAAMPSTNSQRIDTSESESSSSSTAWSDHDVSESQAACATSETRRRHCSRSSAAGRRDWDGSSMGAPCRRCSEDSSGRSLHMRSIDCNRFPNKIGECTHTNPGGLSCIHAHTPAARQCNPTITPRSSMPVFHPCGSTFTFVVLISAVCVRVFLLCFQKEVIQAV